MFMMIIIKYIRQAYPGYWYEIEVYRDNKGISRKYKYTRNNRILQMSTSDNQLYRKTGEYMCLTHITI